MTRAVFFDFYGTLARRITWGPTYEEVLSSFGYELVPGARETWSIDFIDGLDHLEHSESRDAYEEWQITRMLPGLELCGIDAGCRREVAAAMRDATRSYVLAAYDESAAVLDALRARDLTVVVCSNWDWDLDLAVERAGLDGRFDALVTSARAGARKPHERIYQAAMDATGDGLKPSDVLFVGDSWHPDVTGPVEFGMRAVHVQRADDQREVPADHAPAVARVTDLTGVLDLV